MLITKTVQIKITFKNIDYYKEIGFNVKLGDVMDMSTDKLPFYCKRNVEVECDICHKIKTIRISTYHKSIQNGGYYACSQKCSHDKVVKTTQAKYGTDCYNKLEESHKKSKETKLKLHGDENYVNTEKQQATCLRKYGKKSYMETHEFRDKSKVTMNEKYNVDHALQNDEIKENWITTNISTYGTKTPLQNEEVKKKISKTKKELYGDENYNNRPKYFATCLERFGDTTPMRNEEIKQRIVDTFIRNYGETSPMHVDSIVKKCFKNGLTIRQYKETDVYYQSSYEKDFLDKYYDKMTIVRGEPLKYEFNGKTHKYYPDFYIDDLNLMVEIKSSRWYDKCLEMNLAKQEATLAAGYNFIFIINKKYEEFNDIISDITI